MEKLLLHSVVVHNSMVLGNESFACTQNPQIRRAISTTLHSLGFKVEFAKRENSPLNLQHLILYGFSSCYAHKNCVTCTPNNVAFWPLHTGLIRVCNQLFDRGSSGIGRSH